VLRDRTFQRLCGAQFTSLTATYAIFFAVMALVEEVTHSSAQMGVMILTTMLPGTLFGLVAGMAVDRYDRVLVIVVSNGVRLLTGLGFASVTAAFHPPLLLAAIYLVNAFLAVLLQFVAAAEGALLPGMVQADQLLSANAVFNASSLAAHGLGLVLLGPLLLYFLGAKAVGLGSALLFLIALLLAAGLPRGVQTRPEPGSGRATLTWSDFQAGWRYVVHQPYLALAVGQLVLITAMTMLLSTLLPGFVTRVFQMPVEIASWLAFPTGVGYAIGLALVGLSKAQRVRQQWIGRGMLLVSVGMALLALLHRLAGWGIPVFLLAAVSVGLGLAQVNVPARTVLQETPPKGLRGRVIAVELVLAGIASTLPMPFVGGLADRVGMRPVILSAALLTGSVGLAGILLTRHQPPTVASAAKAPLRDL